LSGYPRDINNRNILFHCFKLSGYRQLAITHAHRDEIAVEASQTTPNRMVFSPPMTKKISVMKVIISEI
jgi:hypothetical protein